jgi:uncharacterized lipoprotein YmbA
MKSCKKTAPIAVCAVVLAVGLTACGAGTPSRFYVLSTTAELETQEGMFRAKRRRTIGIGPIKLPAYLDKSQIVTKATRYRLDLAELDQWAEPLKDNVSRVLVEDISILLASDRVHAFPASTSLRDDFQVSIDILAFDCRLVGGCTLTVRWSVFDLRKNRVVSAKRSEYAKVSGQAGYEALAQAMSEALAELSREIAHVVGAL